MSQPRKLTDEAVGEIAATAIARDKLPSDKELSLKWRISMQRVQQIMFAARQRMLGKLLTDESTPTAVGSNPSHGEST